ncbi:MAG: phosphate ABC transporter permease PstA [Fuerstiella sp.]
MTDARIRQRIRDASATVLMWTTATLIVCVLTCILSDILVRGLSQLSWTFLTAELQDAGRSGGIGSIIVSTGLLLMVTLVVAVPLSLATAVALAEQTRTRSRFTRMVQHSLDALAAVPSIVFGLFGNAFFCVLLGMGYSILSGGLTLACMVLPILVRTTEQALRAVPIEYRHAAAALGLSRATILRQIELPVAAPAIAAGLILGLGRAMAETAALIFTSGYVTRMPASLLDSGRAMSVHIYDLAMNVPGGNARAYTTAAVLIVLLVMINAVTTLLTRRMAGRIRDAVVPEGSR